MNEAAWLDVAGLFVARMTGEAVLGRRMRLLTADPRPVFGIAPIQIVSEQRTQALAYGYLGQPPRIVASWNALNREVEALEPFALALMDYVWTQLGAGLLPRIWLPHAAAFELFDLFGHRYARNQAAPPIVQEMGRLCRIIARDSSHPGQQAVVVAGDLLTQHVVVGQSPVESKHLRALLTWCRPLVGQDTLARAEAAALTAASAMLDWADDEWVERLRRLGKRPGTAGATARAHIERILTAAAHAEWALLSEAWTTFWGLDLAPMPDKDAGRLIAETIERLDYTVTQEKQFSLWRQFHDFKDATSFVTNVAVSADRQIQERHRRAGRMFSAVVEGVAQPVPNRKPCTVTLRVAPMALRAREKTTVVRALERHVEGRVIAITDAVPLSGSQADADPERLIVLDITTGVKRAVVPVVGEALTFTDSVPRSMGFVSQRAYAGMKSAHSPLAFGGDLPARAARALPPGDLLAVAEGLRGQRP